MCILGIGTEIIKIETQIVRKNTSEMEENRANDRSSNYSIEESALIRLEVFQNVLKYLKIHSLIYHKEVDSFFLRENDWKFRWIIFTIMVILILIKWSQCFYFPFTQSWILRKYSTLFHFRRKRNRLKRLQWQEHGCFKNLSIFI